MRTSHAAAASALFCAALAFSRPAGAGTDFSIGAKAAETTNKKLLVTAPLPMMFMRRGTWKLSIQPSYVSGKATGEDFLENSPAGSGSAAGDFKSWSGALGFSYAFADRWALYIWGQGSALTGDFTFQNNCSAGPSCPAGSAAQSIGGLKVDNGHSSAGIAFQPFGAVDGSGAALSLFAGPELTRMNLTQTESAPGVYDLDTKFTNTRTGILFGLQAAVPAGGFVFNPFFIFLTEFHKGCFGYDVTSVRSDTIGQQNASTTECSGGSRLFDLHTGAAAAGLNASYRPWGLGLNVTSLLLKNGGTVGYVKGYTTTIVSLSKSFGDYAR